MDNKESFVKKIRALENRFSVDSINLAPAVQAARDNFQKLLESVSKDTSPDSIKAERNILISLVIDRFFDSMENIKNGEVDLFDELPVVDGVENSLDVLYAQTVKELFRKFRNWKWKMSEEKNDNWLLFKRLSDVCEIHNYPEGHYRDKAFHLLLSGLRTAIDIFYTKIDIIPKLYPGIGKDEYLRILKNSKKLSYQLASMDIMTLAVFRIIMIHGSIDSVDKWGAKLFKEYEKTDYDRSEFLPDLFNVYTDHMEIKPETIDMLKETMGVLVDTGEDVYTSSTTGCPALNSRTGKNKPVINTFEEYLIKNLEAYHMPVYERSME